MNKLEDSKNTQVVLISKRLFPDAVLDLKAKRYDLVVLDTIAALETYHPELIILDESFSLQLDHTFQDITELYEDVKVPILLLVEALNDVSFNQSLSLNVFCCITSLVSKQSLLLYHSAKMQYQRACENGLKHNQLNRLLSTNYLVLDTKNQFLEQTKTRLDKLIENDMHFSINELKKLSDSIQKHLKDEYEYQLFKVHFEEVHPSFYKRLLDINDKLSDTNMKLASFIKMGFTNSEIAFFMNVSLAAVKKAVQRMKHKLHIPPAESLRVFLFKL